MVVDSLPSCRDPDIILEVLNFVLSSEVRVLFVSLINLNILKLEVRRCFVFSFLLKAMCFQTLVCFYCFMTYYILFTEKNS